MDKRSLQEKLRSLEGRSYKEYRGIEGDYGFPGFKLTVDYVQGDPFASPSRIRITVPQAMGEFPSQWLTDYECQVAIADYLNRQVAQVASALQKKRGSGGSGKIAIAAPSQAILRRTAVWINKQEIEARLTVGLPAFGRRIAGKAAAALLCEDIPALVERCLKCSALNAATLERHIHTLQDAEALRNQLAPNDLVAFVAQGACLPRRSGIDERPLRDEAETFELPAGEAVELDTPHSGRIKGLGIRRGVTLIVGGGYHGKSTLLRAIEQGIYNHVPGDGREQVVTDRSAIKLRAEDGRSVVGVDISPVINHLPKDRKSTNFSTANASGSTSQAAGLVEAIEVGAKALLIDEDTAATNFMIRDRNMQALIAKEKEPITPLVDKVRQLYNDYGISTLLVMGGSGDYFSVADAVIAMEDYKPKIVTAEAKAIARADTHHRKVEGGEHFGNITSRVVAKGCLPKGKRNRSLKVKARQHSLMLEHEEIDLKAVEQIVEPYQVRAIAAAMIYAQRYYFDGKQPLSAVLDQVMDDIERGGLDALAEDSTPLGNWRVGDWAQFRRYELAAAINRLRTLQIKPVA